MKVLLISTYELGRQPFGLASPAAWLRGRGHEVRLVDLSLSPLPSNAVREADAVAFHLPMHTATRLAVPVIEKVRALQPAARLIAYGLYAPLNAAYLRSLGVTGIVGGEFESGLVDAVEGRPAGPLVVLDRLAFVAPDRATLPALDRYAHLHIGGERRMVGSTEASRGCKHLCRHCPVVPVYQGAFRIVPVEVVMEDVRRQTAAGAQHITFGDPDFFNGPRHAERIIDALHAEFPQLSYDVTIKVEHLLLHRALLPRLAETGCLWVTTAVESVEDLVLERLDKGHTRADFLSALELARAAGLALSPTFVPFTPWTTLAGYRDLLQVLYDQDLVDTVAPIQLALRLLIPEGSRILELPESATWLTTHDAASLLHRWRHPDPRIDQLAERAFALVTEDTKAKRSRRETFASLWQLVNDRPLENFDLLPRAAIPYLDEPWYC